MGRQRMLWAHAVLTVVYDNGSIQVNNDFKLQSRGETLGLQIQIPDQI